MPYVRRDNQGNITAISDREEQGITEKIDKNNPQLIRYLQKLSNRQNLVADTDLSFIRVLEDIIDVLITKNHIRFTDLPSEAQEKFRIRRALRDHDKTKLDILSDDDEGFI